MPLINSKKLSSFVDTSTRIEGGSAFHFPVRTWKGENEEYETTHMALILPSFLLEGKEEKLANLLGIKPEDLLGIVVSMKDFDLCESIGDEFLTMDKS